jgi:hypothetical protein
MHRFGRRYYGYGILKKKQSSDMQLNECDNFTSSSPSGVKS